MSVQAWRIVQTKYQDQAFDGEGARLYGGRWTSQGTSVVYCARSVSLATLEMLVHLPTSSMLPCYVVLSVEISVSLIETLDTKQLPTDWTQYPAPNLLKNIGDDWIASRRSVVLRVPSAVVPFEFNYLLNPAHPGFKKVKIGSPIPFPIDARLI